MRKYAYTMKVTLLGLFLGLTSVVQADSSWTIRHLVSEQNIVSLDVTEDYLLLPIQDDAPEGKICIVKDNEQKGTLMNVRLARERVDSYVPFELSAYKGQHISIDIQGVPANALCWKELKMSDSFDMTNKEMFRPVYHHTPVYGWMNDPNGMFYKDGVYHLYFQYNPYGSVWGNMHWGHSVSKDLIHWDHLNPAIARDTLGHIFSGSTVVDKNNSAGYGKDAIIAFYTSASDEHGQIQCMAYSKDNGRTYTKYEKNPILTPFDGLKDFRDPKVFWYEPAQKWYMIVSADKEMRFYSSSNLKDWEYQSGFGKGYGVQPNQFECPDFIQLPVDGDKNNMKWVMIVNINPGCMFGGSATEYFVGDFDGKEFKCDTKPEVTKWLDFGKDHYATVCFSNTGDRVVAVPWMSNWQYANVTPIRQYRGANALPRELSLYTKDGQIYMAANAVKETAGLRKETRTIDNQTVKGESKIDEIFPQNEGAFEIEMDVTPGASAVAGMELLNDKGEKTKIYLDMKAGKLVMDRTESGLVAFGEKAEPHAIENHDRRKTTSINYKNDFALGTWAPLSLCEGNTYHLQIFVDKCSVEIFANGGRIAMTNLVFPTKPYNSIRLYSEGGDYKVENMKIYKLGL